MILAKRVYVGVDGVARRVKKMYIGVDGVARKIKKGYIGDANGIARLFYTSSEFVQGTFNPLNGAVTINVGFKPKHILIWNTLSQSDAKNKLYSVYSENDFTVDGTTQDTATSLSDSDLNPTVVYITNDWSGFTVSDTGFTFPNMTSYLESGVGNANYIAFGEGHTVKYGTFAPTRNGTNTVSVGFKPDYVVLVGSGSYGEWVTDTRWNVLNTNFHAMNVDDTYAGLFSYEPDFGDNNIKTAASVSGLTITNTGFTFNSSNSYIGGTAEESITSIAYLAIKKSQ